MKTLFLPEQTGFRVLGWCGSLFMGLGLLVVVLWVVLLLNYFFASTYKFGIHPTVLSLLWLYALPLLILGVLLRWLVSVHRLLAANKQLLERIVKRMPDAP